MVSKKTTDNSAANGNGHVPSSQESIPAEPRSLPFRGSLNKEQFESHLQQITLNALMERVQWQNSRLDPRRNLDNDCGYPDSGALSAFFYKQLYDREPVATRVVELMPRESWQVTPMIYEDEDPQNITPFEEAWDNLSKELRGESWFQDEEGSPVWEYLHRVDKLSGIGGFGVLLLGYDDGRPLHEPLEGMVSNKPLTKNDSLKASFPYVLPSEVAFVEQGNSDGGTRLTINLAQSPKDVVERMGGGAGSLYGAIGTEAMYQGVPLGPPEYPSEGVWRGKERKLMFMRPFDESLVQITQYEANMFNPRYGQPIMYRITMNDATEYRGGIGLSFSTLQVHWTRVLHVADSRNSSDVFAVPRMRPVLNPILDIRKVRGGSAEMYWKGAFPGLALSTHPQLGGDVPVDAASMASMMENYHNTIQRYLLLVGMSANTLAPTVVDPTGQIKVQTEAICVQLGCPVRIWSGSERGELASSQDDAAWNDRLRHRQNMYLTPNLIVPFIDRLIKTGILPEPTTGKNRNRIKDKVKAAKAAGKTVESGPAPSGSAPSSSPASGSFAGSQPGKPSSPFGGAKPPGANPFAKPTGNHLVIRNADGSVDEVLTKGGYSVEWPDLDSLGEKDRSLIASQYTTALAAYQSGGIEAIMDFKTYLVNIFEWDEEQAESVVWAAEKNMLDTLDDHADLAAKGEEHDLVPTPPPGFEAKPEPPPPMPGMPGGPPTAPVKMGAGESLVHPETGKTVAKTPFAPVKPKPSTKNAETGDRSTCQSCGNAIEFKGEYWSHKVDGAPELRHPARPKPPTKNSLVDNKYTFDEEDCPECGASMEGDPYSGKCNSCGHKWGREIVENCGGQGGTMGPCPQGDRLRELSAKSITDAHDPAELKVHMDELGKMSGKDLKDVAKNFGINQTQGSKGELLQRIGDKIKMRREMYERTKVHGETTNEGYDEVEEVTDAQMYKDFKREIVENESPAETDSQMYQRLRREIEETML